MQDLENILTNAASDHRMAAPAEAWLFIADALRKRKKRRAAWLFLSLFALIFIGASSSYFYFKKENKNSIQNTVLANNKNDIGNSVPINEDKTEKEVIADSSFSKTNINRKITTLLKKEIKNINNTVNNNYTNKKHKIIENIRMNGVLEQETVFEKKSLIKKSKSKTSVRIIPASEIEEILVTEIAVTEPNTKINEPVITNRLATAQKEDSIKNNIVKKEIEIEKINNKEKVSPKKKSNWNIYLAINAGALFINSKNIFQNRNESLVGINQIGFTSTSNSSASSTSNLANANYQTGKQLSISLLLKKESNYFKPQIGMYLNYSSFNLKAFKATGAILDASTQTLDSSQTGNSLYAAKSTTTSNTLKIKNNLIQIGFSIGASIPLYSFKQTNKILLQTQVIPTYNLSQSIQWYDKTSTRYFTSKKLDNDVNVTQSTAILWQTNIKNRTVLIGPYFNFNYFKINKSLSDVSNIYTQSLGAQLQIKLKK